METTGLIFDIRKFSINDGPGIRTTVFFKGCPLDCWWCHNPESQVPMPEVMLWQSRCIRCGTCIPRCPIEAISANENLYTGVPEILSVDTDREVCTVCGSCIDSCAAEARQIVGRRMTVAEVMAEIERDATFFEESGGGVTFSGGEPMMQRTFLLALLKACRAREIHTALDTSGFTPWEALESVRPYVDLFLFDVKLVDDDRHKQFTGVSNALILENLHALAETGARIVLRMPVIPGVNDDEENFMAMLDLAASERIERVDLLPYHASGEGKYQRLAREYRLHDLHSPSGEQIDKMAARITERGLAVKIGG